MNATPHIGHAYTTLAADILVRHHRQRGDETFFLTGTDEHASKVYRVAEEQGLDVKTYVDGIAEDWRELPRRVNADYDFFIRTTDEGHKRFVQEFLQRIYDNGDIYQDVYAGLYCVGCEEFKSEADLVDGLCPEHGIPPEHIEETNYFFRLSAYQDRLLELYDARPDFVLPRFRYNEARSFIEGGLKDFSVSRAGQPWGVPIPWDEGQVTYVWVDALINYLSALTYARDGEDLRERFWPEVRHLLGKDILRFHCVYWPALLLAAGYDVPKQLFVHGYLLLDERKISKSLGNVIDPLDLVDVYGSDAVRFWALRSVSFGQDGTASVDALHERYERELANDLGNLVSRTTAMIARYRGGRDLAGRPRTRSSPRRSRACAQAGRTLRRVRPHGCARGCLGGRPPAQPSCRGDGSLAARQGRGEGRTSSPRSCTTSRTACARSRSRSRPTCRRRRRASSARSASRSTSRSTRSPTARRARPRGSSRRSRSSRASTFRPRPPERRDGHARAPRRVHGPAEQLVARARAAGIERIVSVGSRPRLLPRDARDRRDGSRASGRRSASTRTRPRDPDAERLDELRELLSDERAVAVGETGLDFYRDYAPRDRQRELFDRQLDLAAELGKPVVVHTRNADDETAAALEALPGHGRPPLLLQPRAPPDRARARLLRLLRRERHVPEGRGAARGRSPAFRPTASSPRRTART